MQVSSNILFVFFGGENIEWDQFFTLIIIKINIQPHLIDCNSI